MRCNFLDAIFRLWRALFGYDIFLSYSSRNALYADALRDSLKRAGFRVVPGGALQHKRARESRMLVAVAGAGDMDENVRSGIDAFLAAPGTRRMAAIFFGAVSPQMLPSQFGGLKSFRGIRADPADLDPPVIRRDVVEQIERSFRAMRSAPLRLVATALLTLSVAAAYWMQLESRTSVEARDHWLGQFRSAQRETRADLQEIALANAAESQPGAAAELLDPYREARARRLATPQFRANAPRSYTLLHIGDYGPEPYLVLRDSENGSLWLDAGSQRTLIGSRCGSSPLVASGERGFAFTCASDLLSVDPGDPSRVRKVRLGAVPDDVAIDGDELRTIEDSSAGVPVVTGRDAVTLETRWSQKLQTAPPSAPSGLCRGSRRLAWSVNIEERRIVIRRWERGGAQVLVERVASPSPGHWITGVKASAECDRFIVNQGMAASAQGGEFVRIGLEPSPRAAGFDPEAQRIVALSDRSGYEALYLTGSRDLRALLRAPADSPRTLASGIRVFEIWPAARFGAKMAAVAADSEWLSIFLDGRSAARYPVLVKDPVRLLVSPDGRFAAVQGEDGIAVWQVADKWGGQEIPPVEELTRQLRLTWARGDEPEYRIPAR